MFEATCTWSGQLPPKIYRSPTYSCKVFLGGVPWDITEGKCCAYVTQQIVCENTSKNAIVASYC